MINGKFKKLIPILLIICVGILTILLVLAIDAIHIGDDEEASNTALSPAARSTPIPGAFDSDVASPQREGSQSQGTDTASKIVTGVSEWAPGTNYAVGDVVVYKGKVYKSILQHTAQVGWEPEIQPALWVPTGETGEGVKQTLPQISGASEWKPGVNYSTGNAVTYSGSVYTCLQPHTSQTGWEPAVAPALWQPENGNASGGQSSTSTNNTSNSQPNVPLATPIEEVLNYIEPDQKPNPPLPPASGNGKRIVGYYTEWSVYSAHNMYNPSDIPWDKLTHINYAFAKPSGGKLTIFDGWAATGIAAQFGETWDSKYMGAYGQFKKLKPKHPNTKVLISVGGWTLSGEFHSIASSEASRSTFADSCVEFIRKWDFDGIDIDWEYPGVQREPDKTDNPNDTGNPAGPEDKHNFTLLLKTLRGKLDSAGSKDKKYYSLTIAAPAGYDKIKFTEPDQYYKYLDFINIMTYDYHGAWETVTNHQSPLYAHPSDPSSKEIAKYYNTDWVVNEYIRLGVPASKLNIGVPYYCRGWKGVDSKTGKNGLFAKAQGGANGIWDGGVPAGNHPFYYVKTNLESNASFKKYRDPYAQVPYLYDATAGLMYTYEDEISLENKCNYVLNKKLGGMMFWELSGDYPAKGSTMTDIIYKKLGAGK